MSKRSDAELIKEKIDLVEFINSYLPLKKAGRNFKGLCPFHAEKTPSFFVSPERNFYHCFGCQKSGDVFTFLMEKEGLSFPEALQFLAGKVGVKLSKQDVDTGSSTKKEKLLTLSLLASEYYHYLLLRHPVGKRALSYLKKRGVAPESINKFKLGYAPNSWESTGKFLLARGFSKEDLLEAGLIISKKSEAKKRDWYDRFRGRVMFPIFDVLGRVVGFSGRSLEDKPNVPKYLNSPDSVIFQKGKLLYGLNLAKETVRTQNSAILVEGNLDVVSVFQAGIKNVLAPLGTGFTKEQGYLIKRFSQNVVLAFDNDKAGERATLSGIKLGLELGLGLKVAQVTNGKDPDEAVQHDARQFSQDVDSAGNFFDYLFKLAQKKFSLEETTGKANTAKLILPFLVGLPDKIAQDSLVKKLAQQLGVEEKSVWGNLRQIEMQTAKQKTFGIQPENPLVHAVPRPLTQKPRQELLADHFLMILLALPSTLWSDERLRNLLFNRVSPSLFSNHRQKLILEKLVESFAESQKIDPRKIALVIKEAVVQKEMDLLLLRGSNLTFSSEEIFWQNLEKIWTELELFQNKEELKKLILKLEKAKTEEDNKKIKHLRTKIKRLNKRLLR